MTGSSKQPRSLDSHECPSRWQRAGAVNDFWDVALRFLEVEFFQNRVCLDVGSAMA